MCYLKVKSLDNICKYYLTFFVYSHSSSLKSVLASQKVVYNWDKNGIASVNVNCKADRCSAEVTRLSHSLSRDVCLSSAICSGTYPTASSIFEAILKTLKPHPTAQLFICRRCRFQQWKFYQVGNGQGWKCVACLVFATYFDNLWPANDSKVLVFTAFFSSVFPLGLFLYILVSSSLDRLSCFRWGAQF